VIALQCWHQQRSQIISKTNNHSDCVILDKDAFDPDAVFMQDIVDDDVLPRLSLAVDGLVEPNKKSASSFEIPTDDVVESMVIKPSTTMPVATFDPEILEVYGWESSLWRKVRGYLGF